MFNRPGGQSHMRASISGIYCLLFGLLSRNHSGAWRVNARPKRFVLFHGLQNGRIVHVIDCCSRMRTFLRYSVINAWHRGSFAADIISRSRIRAASIARGLRPPIARICSVRTKHSFGCVAMRNRNVGGAQIELSSGREAGWYGRGLRDIVLVFKATYLAQAEVSVQVDR